ncbi:hypothetical protein [endosymbiont of Ridgeia piscesae]|uniref:hypothetical protein n=1 Tax=endosymbiont of Ridgeia piscesae TaxID=54398 RepID=UPI001305328E|nr:hypothetical protein [endosymbiont of Ridgeia piscesae]
MASITMALKIRHLGHMAMVTIRHDPMRILSHRHGMLPEASQGTLPPEQQQYHH